MPTAEQPSCVRYRVSVFYAALLTLGLFPALLALPFSSSQVFCCFSVFALNLLLLVVARRKFTVLCIVLPSYASVLFTPDLSVQTSLLGILFAAAAGAFLLRGRRTAFALFSLLGAALIVSLTRGPAFLLYLLLPAAGAAALAFLWWKHGLSGTVIAAAAALVCAAALTLAAGDRLGILPDGTVFSGGLSGLADALRAALAAHFNAVQLAASGHADERASAILAENLVNVAPAVVFVAALALSFCAHRLADAFASSVGLEDRMPENVRRITVSPVCGFTMVAACLAYLFANSSDFGSDSLSFPAAAAVNVIFVITPVLCICGTRFLHGLILRRLLRADEDDRGRFTAATILVAVLALVTSVFFIVISAFAGMIFSLLPVFSALRAKLSGGDNDLDDNNFDDNGDD